MSIKHAFKLSSQQAQYSRRIPALMGLASGTTTAPGGLGLKYVRVWMGSSVFPSQALDPNGIAPAAHTPIWIDVGQDKRMYISGVRYTGS